VLTKSDDFPIHQISSPISEVGATRNFYDRYFLMDIVKMVKFILLLHVCLSKLKYIDAAFTFLLMDFSIIAGPREY